LFTSQFPLLKQKYCNKEFADERDKSTSDDMCFTLEGVRCIGCCSLGPVIKVNEDVHGRIGAGEVDDVLNIYE